MRPDSPADAPGAPASDHDRPPLPESLRRSVGFMLSKAAQRAIEMSEGALRPLGIRSRHYGVLAALAEAGPLSQQRLGEWLRIDRTTMVGILDDLERLGFAQRHPDPADRRAYSVQLTSAGEAALARAEAILAAVDSELVAQLSEEERRRLHELLSQIV